MTDYPVQCFEHKGKPYGRYCNLLTDGHLYSLMQAEFEALEIFAEHNTFPFPSGIIGQTYDRDEVEVGYQSRYLNDLLTIDFSDCSFEEYQHAYRSCSSLSVRQIFRLIPQSVEKEPETVEQTLNMTVLEKLNYITSIKYKCWGAPMIGVFRSANKIWTIYFRNPDDDVLRELFKFEYLTFEDCVNDMYDKVKEWEQHQ